MADADYHELFIYFMYRICIKEEIISFGTEESREGVQAMDDRTSPWSPSELLLGKADGSMTSIGPCYAHNCRGTPHIMHREHSDFPGLETCKLVCLAR